MRWVHSSEVLEIAPLLQGGELLLTGGHVLAGVDRAAQERYVRELDERRVAGVAIETGPVLPTIPDGMLRAADQVGFPVIELRAVVPFVGVTEVVNAELVNESVTRLRFGGELAHALSLVLGQQEGVQPLVEELARRTGSPVVLVDAAGETLAEAGDSRQAGGDADAQVEEDSLRAVTTRVAVRGVHVATLVFRPDPGLDHELLSVAGDRAVEALGLALLRTSSPSPREIAASELARSAHRPDLAARLTRLGSAAGFRPDDALVALVVEGWRHGWPGHPGLEPLLHRHGTLALDLGGTDVRAVLAIADRRHAEQSRGHLVSELQDWAAHQREVVVSVGPAVAGLAGLPTSMRAAVAAIGGAHPFGAGVVRDAAVTMVTDWLQGDDLRVDVAEFVRGQLGMVLDLGPAESSTMLETLEAYLDVGCSKTRAADVLHLRRQSLYARLDKVFTALGGDPTGTPRALPLHLALKLRHSLQTPAFSGRRRG